MGDAELTRKGIVVSRSECRRNQLSQKFIPCNTEIFQECLAISRSGKTAGVNTEDELLGQHGRPLIKVGQSGRPHSIDGHFVIK